MENITTPIEELFDKAQEYAKTSTELFMLTAIDKSANVMSSLASQLVIFIVVAMFAILLSIGLSVFIGNAIGNNYIGFFIVAAVYFLLSVLLYIFRIKWIKIPFQNSIIQLMIK